MSTDLVVRGCVLALSVWASADGHLDQLDDAQKFQQLSKDVDSWILKQSQASPSGEPASGECAATQEFRERLDKIDLDRLSNDDRINGLVLRKSLFEWQCSCDQEPFHFPIGPFWGVHRTLQEAQMSRFATVADCKRYIDYVRSTANLIDKHIQKMRDGLAAGYTLPKSTLIHVPAELQTLIDSNLQALQYPFSESWNVLPAAQRDVLWRQFITVEVPSVKRSLERLRDFLEKEYLPNCRESIALCDLPNGAEVYRARLRVHGDTEQTPAQLHELGMTEVQRIWPLMIETIKQTEFYRRQPELAALDEQSLFSAFRIHLNTDPQFRYQNEEQVLQAYRNTCKIVDMWLPSMFKTLPRLTFGVTRSIAGGREAGVVSYRIGDLERGMVSVFQVELKQLADHPTFAIAPYALHEGSPGHHLQMALTTEKSELPLYRRRAWFTAYGEGWAMYAERLGYEMHMYDDPYAKFGQLHSELHRACRLVIDPAIHALGWSRDKATDFLRSRTLLTDAQVEQEINRYVTWPAQAVSYKLGELKFRELRERAARELGPKFDLREFHDALLSSGSLPLDVLEQRVNEWITANSAAQQRRRSQIDIPALGE